MSEPVGNGPRLGNIPNNSNKAREEVKAPSREKLDKVVTGKVVERKQPWFRKASRSILAEDAGTIGSHLLSEVVLPAVRDLIYNIVVGGASRSIYGTTRGIGYSSNGSRIAGGTSSLRTAYHNIPESRPLALSASAQATHQFRELVLEHQDAVAALRALVTHLDEFKTVTVADFYDILGVSGSFMDRKWGWTDLSGADIRQVPNGWILDLPPTKQL